MIRVLHVLASPHEESDAIVQIVEQLRRGLDPYEFELCAVFLGGDGPQVEKLKSRGIAAAAINWPHHSRIVSAWKFWRLLRTMKPDIIHQHQGGRTVRKIVRASTAAKIIFHLHGAIGESEVLEHRDIPLPDTDVVIANSNATASLAPGRNPIVIYGGIDISLIKQPVKHEGVVIGTAGRLVHIKGLHDLIDAIGQLASSYPGLRLHIAGDGPERAQLERLSAELGLGECVRFVGWQEDVWSFLSRCDIFAHPSHQEGFGMSVLQAMANRLPVVATNVGGLPELVADGITGFLIPPRNPRALAEALKRLLDDRSIQVRMGSAGRNRAATYFSTEQMVSRVREVYLDLVRNN